MGWTALHQASEVGTMTHVDQLLLEVHMRGCEAGYTQHGRSKLSGLMDALEGSGLRAFSNVPNLGPTGKGALPACGEYSFVNVRSSFVTQMQCVSLPLIRCDLSFTSLPA